MKARQRANRLWHEVRPFYKTAGPKAPRMEFLGRGEAQGANAFVTPEDRTVHVALGMKRAMKRNKPLTPAVRKVLLHEWRHVFQAPKVWADPDVSVGERDASNFAGRVNQTLKRRQAKRSYLDRKGAQKQALRARVAR